MPRRGPGVPAQVGASPRRSAPSGAALRRHPLNDPATWGSAVPEPVVQAAFTGLPEFDRFWREPVTAPEIRHRHAGAGRPAALELGDALVQIRAGCDHPGLPAGP